MTLHMNMQGLIDHVLVATVLTDAARSQGNGCGMSEEEALQGSTRHSEPRSLPASMQPLAFSYWLATNLPLASKQR